MAKPRKRHHRDRDASVIASDRPRGPSIPSHRALAHHSLPNLNYQPRDPVAALSEIEDRRIFTPDPDPPVKSSRRWHSRLSAKPKQNARPSGRSFTLQPAIQAFKAPTYIALCIRRGIRKEVLHALGKTGKGSRSPKKRSSFSNIWCK